MTYQNEAARKVRKQKKTHRETRQRPQEVDGEASDTEPACDVHLSFTPCSHPQLPRALAACVRNKDQEVGLGKGGWASGCQSEVHSLLATPSSDGHPTPGPHALQLPFVFKTPLRPQHKLEEEK